ncbi:MAG: metal-dependent transcriptional regulator [Streptosporangiales bacterium]|nr:metal-dependent transcriptional regulator [Streptosporangiales bacterium]
MGVSELSSSAQNYLKTIWNLQEWSDSPVTASVIADRMGLRLSTVSDGVRKLTSQGLVAHAPYGTIDLTDAGRSHAMAMVRRHRLIETFLVQVLEYRWDEVHDEAETLEHAVSDLMIDRIDRLLQYPPRDPHGDPIPSAEGAVTAPRAAPLSSGMAGSRVVVQRISDADPAMLQYFATQGIVLDAQLDVMESEPYSGTVVVRVAGKDTSTSLGGAAASAIWVSPPATS